MENEIKMIIIIKIIILITLLIITLISNFVSITIIALIGYFLLALQIHRLTTRR